MQPENPLPNYRLPSFSLLCCTGISRNSPLKVAHSSANASPSAPRIAAVTSAKPITLSMAVLLHPSEGSEGAFEGLPYASAQMHPHSRGDSEEIHLKVKELRQRQFITRVARRTR